MKKGIRVLGVAESFYKGKSKSIIVGMVQRRDLIIDGFTFSLATLGGIDSTDKILEIIHELNRKDINYIIISGSIISWYNIIDLPRIYWETRIPTISLTYEETEGIIKYIIEYFPRDWHYRLLIHLKNGSREPLSLHTGYNIFMRRLGLEYDEATKVVNAFTLEGKYPEPIRIARLIAHRIARKIIKYF